MVFMSLSRSVAGRFRPSALTRIGWLRKLSSETQIDEDQIKSLVSYVTTRIDEIAKSGKPPLPCVYAAEVYVVKENTNADTSEVARLKYLSKTVENIKTFLKLINFRSMLNDDIGSDLTKDDITSRVVNVIQSYPKVGNYKVTEETHFVEDIGLDKWDVVEIIQALQIEFKLYVHDHIVSCKHAIEYIYDHRSARFVQRRIPEACFSNGRIRRVKGRIT